MYYFFLHKTHSHCNFFKSILFTSEHICVICEFYPPRRAHSKSITSCFKQKGVEFDPFEFRIVYFFPKSQKLNGSTNTQLIFNDIFRLNEIFTSRNVGYADIILFLKFLFYHFREKLIFQRMYFFCHIIRRIGR